MIVDKVLARPHDFTIALLGTTHKALITVIKVHTSYRPVPMLVVITPTYSVTLTEIAVSSRRLPPSAESDVSGQGVVVGFKPATSHAQQAVSANEHVQFS